MLLGSKTYHTISSQITISVWCGVYFAGLQTPPVVTTDFLYVRFIGDRSIQEKDFGRIQIDRIAEMQKWAENIKNVQEHTNLAIGQRTITTLDLGLVP